MKKILLLLLISSKLFAQAPVNVSQPQIFSKWIKAIDSMLLVNEPAILDSSKKVPNTSWIKRVLAARIIDSNKVKYIDSTVKYVTPFQASQMYVMLQTQAPSAAIFGGASFERMATGASLVTTLNWQATRAAATFSAAATNPISAIRINGVSQFFTQPIAGGSTSGSYLVGYSRNSNATYYLDVFTTDSKTVEAFATFTFYDKRYIGWAATSTPTDSEIRAAIVQDNSGGTISYSAALSQLNTSQYLFYANTVNVNSITVNGFPSTSSFTLNISRTFTNVSGGQSTYLVTTSNNSIGATSSTSINFN